jgi:hypothetical protein
MKPVLAVSTTQPKVPFSDAQPLPEPVDVVATSDEQLAVVPPLLPEQVHSHLAPPEITLGVPEVQSVWPAGAKRLGLGLLHEPWVGCATVIVANAAQPASSLKELLADRPATAAPKQLLTAKLLEVARPPDVSRLEPSKRKFELLAEDASTCQVPIDRIVHTESRRSHLTMMMAFKALLGPLDLYHHMHRLVQLNPLVHLGLGDQSCP